MCPNGATQLLVPASTSIALCTATCRMAGTGSESVAAARLQSTRNATTLARTTLFSGGGSLSRTVAGPLHRVATSLVAWTKRHPLSALTVAAMLVIFTLTVARYLSLQTIEPRDDDLTMQALVVKGFVPNSSFDPNIQVGAIVSLANPSSAQPVLGSVMVSSDRCFGSLTVAIGPAPVLEMTQAGQGTVRIVVALRRQPGPAAAARVEQTVRVTYQRAVVESAPLSKLRATDACVAELGAMAKRGERIDLLYVVTDVLRVSGARVERSDLRGSEATFGSVERASSRPHDAGIDAETRSTSRLTVDGEFPLAFKVRPLELQWKKEQ